MAARVQGSFRDPGGIVYWGKEGVLLRQVNPPAFADFQALMNSGLYTSLVGSGLLVPHESAPLEWRLTEGASVVLRPERIPVISYPYEWSFSQLKDAALATLGILTTALEHGLVLKDASAYNIQFKNGCPLLIDTLSFEKYEEGQPWIAYGQFCRHFLAPLALMSLVDIRLGSLLRNYVDGIPLDLASRLLPGKTKFSAGLAMHLHLHAKSTLKHGDRKIEKKANISKHSLLGLIDSLQSTVKGLDWTPQGTEWGEYYADTNYTREAMGLKETLVAEMSQGPYALVWDFGANTGEFSAIAGRNADAVVAWDIDPAAVEKHYLRLTQKPGRPFLPLLLDLANPTPSVGWSLQERDSLLDRGPADLLLALALVHHLAIGNNVPLPDVAAFFAKCGRELIIEFVPKEDSQVQRLLANREDIFPDYRQDAFEEAFQQWFTILRRAPIEGSARTLYRMQRLP